MSITRVLVVAMLCVLLSWVLMALGAVHTSPWFSVLMLGMASAGAYALIRGRTVHAPAEQTQASEAQRTMYLDPRNYKGSSCVYVLQDCTLTGWYKIGYTGNLTERIRTISRTKLPVPLHLGLVAVIPSDTPGSLERRLHQRFADKRVRGEWFALSPADIDWLLQQTPESLWQQVR